MDLIEYIGFQESMSLLQYLKWVREVPRRPMPFTPEELEIIQEAMEALRRYEAENP
jgi:hypothetical protein